MTLYIDGDAFPNLLKPIILRAVQKRRIPTVIVANKRVSIGDSPQIRLELVEAGADRADDRIVECARPGDLVITADIPLADRLVSRGIEALDHRGTLYTRENIKQLLAMRNLMEEIRNAGEMTGGPKPFGPKDAHAFANAFNAFLSRKD
ncbi:YaiI/YqxD family protein [Nitratifractor sp.]